MSTPPTRAPALQDRLGIETLEPPRSPRTRDASAAERSASDAVESPRPHRLRESLSVPDSNRGNAAIADLDALVAAADRPMVDAQVEVIVGAPGAALLVWGPDAVCLAYNRAYRSLASLRTSAAGKPLFKVQPEVERALRVKLDAALAGQGAAIDGSCFAGASEGLGGDPTMGWLVPIPGGEGGSRGVLALLMDVGAMLEPMRRLFGAVAQDLREPLIGIQVVSERLARLPKPTRERCAEDMERVLDLAQNMDRLVDDMGAFARRAGGGGGARLSLRHGDLGAIVRDACQLLSGGKYRPIQVKASEAPGLWDEDAIRRIVTTLVTSARQHNAEDGNVSVEVLAGREAVVISVRDDGPALRAEEMDQLFEPWKRGAPGAGKRRRAPGIGMFLARELVLAHGGKIASERPPQGGFVVRVSFPTSVSTPSSPRR